MSPSKTEMDPAKRDLLLQKSKYFLTATHEDWLAYMTGDASTIEELDRKYQEKERKRQERERKRKKKELQRQMENLPLMRTTIIEKTGRALLNCEALNTDEARMKTPLEALFGAKARSNSLDIKNIIKVMGYIGASNETFKNLFEKYKKPLALKYEQLIFKDDYGDFDESLVLKEYKSFLSKKTDGLFFAKRCDTIRMTGEKTYGLLTSDMSQRVNSYFTTVLKLSQKLRVESPGSFLQKSCLPVLMNSPRSFFRK